MKESIDDFFKDAGVTAIGGFEDGIYSILPRYVREITDKFEKKDERDAALMALITIIGSLCRNYYSRYKKKTIQPTFYTYVVANAGEGKGMLDFIRMLAEPTEQRLNDIYEREMWMYNLEKRSNSGLLIPQRKSLLIPGDITKAKLVSMLYNNDGRGLMIETEADTVSMAMDSKYGGYGDILRKGYHGEPHSIGRKTDDVDLRIAQIWLSVLLSSTYGQIKKLIKDYENGLVSRFDFLQLVSTTVFDDVLSDDDCDGDYESWFRSRGEELADFHDEMKSIEDGNIYFTYAKHHRENFKDIWGDKKLAIHREYGDKYMGLVNRQGFKSAKLAMIFGLMRTYFDRGNASLPSSIVATEDDLSAAISMSFTLLENNIYIGESLTSRQKGNYSFIQQDKEDIELKERAIALYVGGTKSLVDICKEIGKDPKNKNTVRRWLIEAGVY